MKKILLRFYSIYVYLVFIVTGLFFINAIILLSLNKKWHVAALSLNHIWSKIFFVLIGVPTKIKWETKLSRKEQYIFCANHFSYMDIPVTSGFPIPFKFIGKVSITKAPLFGYMFKKLHITVDRSTAKSRAESLNVSRNALREGFNLMFFPEGGIRSAAPPKMTTPFKDGAFRLAVETNVPIVPVSMPDNYRLLPDNGSFLFSPVRCRATVHAPIYPKDYDNDVDKLKAAVRVVIENELSAYTEQKVAAVS